MTLIDGLRIGIQLPEVEREVRWPEYRDMAQAADDLGFDSIWVGDHLLYRGDGRPERGPWEAWTLLAALAGCTNRVELGPLVACLGFHPPAVIAKLAATVDEVSNGRLVLGVGAGWNEVEYQAFGLPFDRRASRFEEAFDIVYALVNRQRITLDGDFNRVDDVVLLPAPARDIPIMVGSLGERVLRHSLDRATWWNTWFDWFGNTPDGFARENERVDRFVADLGRDPRTLKRSTCALVEVVRGAVERPLPTGYSAISLTDLPTTLQLMREAGADEVILVCNPIDESSIRTIAATLGKT